MIIALETASPDISVALATPDGTLLAVDGWASDRRQGHETLPRLLRLLVESSHGLEEASAVAVGTGPGSFTGLRVGMSLAKGLAIALDLPLVGIPSLESWLAAEPSASGAAARAGAREAYLLIRGEAQPRIVERDALPAAAAPDAVLVASDELAESFGLRNAVSPRRAAAAIARAAAIRLQAEPSGDDLARLEPTYIRAPRGTGQVAHVEAP